MLASAAGKSPKGKRGEYPADPSPRERQEGPTGEPSAWALWLEGAGRPALRAQPLAAPGPGEVEVRTLYSAISRGSERLVFEGRVPAAEHQRMRCPMQEGDFQFPVKYGYCAVGRVTAGEAALLGRTVFALHPHQDRFVVPAQAVTPVPEDVPARRAVLAANMETALNGVWDAGACPASRVAVVGGGILGLLVAHLLARLPGAQVTLVDVDGGRAGLAEALGARFALPEAAPSDCDLVVHASASAAGLATAIAAAGVEATVLEMSWYGMGEVAAPLGGAFHARRLRLVSSQVGAISPAMRPRWDHRRRMAAAMELLADPRLDALVAHEIAFADCPALLAGILRPGAPGLPPVIRYS